MLSMPERDRNFPDCGRSAKGDMILTLSQVLSLSFPLKAYSLWRGSLFSVSWKCQAPQRVAKGWTCLSEMSLPLMQWVTPHCSLNDINDGNQSTHAWLTTDCGGEASALLGVGWWRKWPLACEWLLDFWLRPQFVLRPQQSLLSQASLNAKLWLNFCTVYSKLPGFHRSLRKSWAVCISGSQNARTFECALGAGLCIVSSHQYTGDRVISWCILAFGHDSCEEKRAVLELRADLAWGAMTFQAQEISAISQPLSV